MAVTGTPSLADNGTEGSRSFVNKLEPEPQQPAPAAPWHLFPLRNLQIVCMLVSARSQTNKSFTETGVTLSQPVVDLAPGQSEPYSCPLHVAVDLREGDKIVRAKIDFISQYDSRWPWGGRSKSESEVFTLNTSPPQWLAGDNAASTTASR
jgi:hypothetical protein